MRTLLVLLVFSCFAQAEDAAKIVDLYVKAAGGAKALSRIQTLAIEGTLAGGSFTLNTRAPNRYYSELVVDGKSWIEAYSGKSAWRKSEAGDIVTLLGQESSQLEAAGQYYNARLLKLKTNKIARHGDEQVRGRDAWHMEVTAANGVKRQVFFDTATHLIVEERSILGGVDEAIAYSDYRNVDGVQLPFRIELQRGRDTYQIAVTRAEINGQMGEHVFDFPRRIDLPDLQALFKKIADNQRTIHKIKENYTGTRTEEETEYDGRGNAKESSMKKYTFFYLGGDEVSTLVERDGKPLSEGEQKKESEKTRKRIEELQKHPKQEKIAERGIEMFLRACLFVNPRRERYRGQDMLVFDFEPNPQFVPRRLEERLVQKLAGVAWIDEKALSVARLQAYFVGDVKIGAGLLANVRKGANLVFEQAFINNEVWLPTYQGAQMDGRVLLLKGFKVSEVTRYSDYRKFDVQTLANIGKP